MSNHYREFLERLIQYRTQLCKTQEEVSRELGITQSQLSKQELGKTIMNYKSLVKLMNMGWDVDYLFTGNHSERKTSELTVLLEGTDTEHQKSMLEFISWALAKGIVQSVPELSMEEKCEIKILEAKSGNEEDSSIMYEIRKLSGDAQMAMADKLGVNIKKYRALEKQTRNPDAELIMGIYETTGCKPTLFLTTDRIEALLIDDLWSRILPEKQKEILAIAKQINQFLRA
ncbi:MAG: helix-turn-helix domain-containing protein [Lachnospiraceae bacterium]|nr:helix-turn-helix domain-containing protein [Lachnospiraceae bacterium]